MADTVSLSAFGVQSFVVMLLVYMPFRIRCSRLYRSALCRSGYCRMGVNVGNWLKNSLINANGKKYDDP